MPPQPPLPADQDRARSYATPCKREYAMLFKVFLLSAVLAIGLRLSIARYVSRKRRISKSEPGANVTEKSPVPLYSRAAEKIARPGSSAGEKIHKASLPHEPIYPWTSPPQPLPGPYDPRLYPLPTIRRHSYDPSVEAPQELAAISYTRRVSLNSIPTEQSTLRGAVTISSKGWRRNQWIISGD